MYFFLFCFAIPFKGSTNYTGLNNQKIYKSTLKLKFYQPFYYINIYLLKEFQNEVLSTRDYSSPGLAFVNPISNLHSNELPRSGSTIINIEQLSPSIKYKSLLKEWLSKYQKTKTKSINLYFESLFVLTLR